MQSYLISWIDTVFSSPKNLPKYSVMTFFIFLVRSLSSCSIAEVIWTKVSLVSPEYEYWPIS